LLEHQLNVWFILPSIQQAIDAASVWSAVDGTYFVEGEDGLFLYVSFDRAGKVQFLYLDQTVEYDQATISVRDRGTLREYPLFIYQQQVKVGEELVERSILVYLDGATYVVVNDYEGKDGLPAVEAGTRVRFALDANDGINEEATLEPVVGYGTRYAQDAEFKAQAELFAEYFAGADTPYLLNLLADGTTDSIDDFDLVVTEFQALLVKAFLRAATATTATLPNTTNYRLNALPTPPVVGTNTRLSNGRYFASVNANEKGEQFFGLFLVQNNVITNAFIDATRFVDGEVTTFTALGQAETPRRAGVTVEPTNDDFFEKIGADVRILVQSGFQAVGGSSALAGIANGFGYTSRDDITIVPATSGVYSLLVSYQNPIRLLHHAVAEQGLRAWPADYAKLVLANWKALNTDLGAARALYSATQTANPDLNVISYADVNTSGLALFNAVGGADNTARFQVRYDSLDRTVANLSTTGFNIVPERGLTANATARFTMQLDFDGETYTETLSVQVKSVVSWNRDVIAAAIAAAPAAASTPLFQRTAAGAQNGFDLGAFNGLNNMVTISGLGYGKVLPQDLGLVIDGTAPGVTIPGVNNVTYWLNFGTTTATQIPSDELNLSKLAPGKHTITARIVYASGLSTTFTPQFITQSFDVEVLTPTAARDLGLAHATPGIIIPNGEVSADFVTLPLKHPTVSGLTYSWEVVEGSGNARLVAPLAGATTQRMNITRLYSQDRVRLQLTVVGQGITTGAVRVFEFRVLPATALIIEDRIEADLADIFQRAPRYFDMTKSQQALALGTKVVTLTDLVNTSLLSTDSGVATLVFAISSNNAGLQAGAVGDVANNLVYVDSGTKELRLARNAFFVNGEVDITVSATIEIRYLATNVAADLTYTDSFTFTLFNEASPSSTLADFVTEIAIYSGLQNYIVFKPNFNEGLLDLDNRLLQQGVKVDAARIVVSGTSASEYYREVAIPAAALNNPGVLTFVDLPAFPATLTGNLVVRIGLEIDYSFYLDGVLTKAAKSFEIPATPTGPSVTINTQDNGFISKSSFAPSNGNNVVYIPLTEAYFRPTLDGAQLLAAISGVGNVTAANNETLAAIRSGVIAGTFDFVTDADGNRIAVSIRTSGVLDTTAVAFGLRPSAFFRIDDGSVAGMANTAFFTADGAAINTTNIAFASIANGNNFIEITLDGNAVFRPGALNKNTIVLLASGTANTPANLNSGVLADLRWVQTAPNKAIAFISNGAHTNSGLLKGSVDGGIQFAINSGAYIYKAATPAVSSTTIGTLAFNPEFGYSVQLTPLTDTLENLLDDNTLRLFVRNATLRSKISQSDLVFSGLNAKVFEAADVIRVSDTQIALSGITNLQGAADKIEIWILPSAFATVTGAVDVVDTQSTVATITAGTLGGSGLVGTFTGGATITNSQALTVKIADADKADLVLALTKGNEFSTVKYFKGAEPSNDAGYTQTFAAGTQFTVADNDIIWLLVIAEDTTTKLYYKITVTVE
jgi:hypothetical protein